MTKYRLNRLNEIVDCVVRVGRGGATRKQIAECLGIKVTQHLTAMINQCIAEGYLTSVLDDAMPRKTWKYFNTDKAVV